MSSSPESAPSEASLAKIASVQWQQIADTFCPQVRLANYWVYDEDDPYQPSSIDWFLQRSRLFSPDHAPILKPGYQDLLLHNDQRSYLRLIDTDDRGGDVRGAQMYVHIRRAPRDVAFVDIQYWFFYPYNGAVPIQPFYGNHDGDWEHITVRISNWQRGPGQIAIEAIFFAAHGYEEGRWLTQESPSPRKNRYALLPNTRHPIVYSAYYTHGSYESAGWQYRDVLGGWLGDYTSDKGKIWEPAPGTAQIVSLAADLVQDHLAIPEPGWLKFKGRWGYDEGETGPEGPRFQDPWENDGENGFYGHLLEPLSRIGDDWSPVRYATSIAFGRLAGQDVVGVTRDYGDGSTFIIYAYDQKLKYMAVGGQNWPASRNPATSIAFGQLNGEDIVLVGAAGPKGFVGCYRWNGARGNLEPVFEEEIGVDVNSTKVAFGVLDDRPAIGIACKTSGYGAFYVKMFNDDGTLKTTLTGGDDWYHGATSIAFGELDGWAVAVTRAELEPGAPRESAYLYHYDEQRQGLRVFASDRDLWGSKPIYGGNDIKFGVLDNTPVVAITTASGVPFGAGPKLLVCRYSKPPDERNGQLQVIASGWSDSKSLIGPVSFGQVNGRHILSVGGANYRQGGSGKDPDLGIPNPILYTYDGGLQEYYQVKDPAETPRGGAATALGYLGEPRQPVYGVVFGNLINGEYAKPKALLFRWNRDPDR